MTLAYDIARCPGANYGENGVDEWREGCATCMRRTSPLGPRTPVIQPPPIIVFECEFLIEPRGIQ